MKNECQKKLRRKKSQQKKIPIYTHSELTYKTKKSHNSKTPTTKILVPIIILKRIDDKTLIGILRFCKLQLDQKRSVDRNWKKRIQKKVWFASIRAGDRGTVSKETSVFSFVLFFSSVFLVFSLKFCFFSFCVWSVLSNEVFFFF